MQVVCPAREIHSLNAFCKLLPLVLRRGFRVSILRRDSSRAQLLDAISPFLMPYCRVMKTQCSNFLLQILVGHEQQSDETFRRGCGTRGIRKEGSFVFVQLQKAWKRRSRTDSIYPRRLPITLRDCLRCRPFCCT